MIKMKLVLLFISFILSLGLKAQTKRVDTLNLNDNACESSVKKPIIPSTLVVYGIFVRSFYVQEVQGPHFPVTHFGAPLPQ